jgi:uncharacterized repeat protein (TIGR01451 family)
VRNQSRRSIDDASRRVVAWLMAFAILLAVPAFTGVAQAAATTNGATLNGGSTVTVGPGASITAAVTATSGNGLGNRVASIGWRIATSAPGSVTCVDVVPDQNAQRATTSFQVTAPSSAGTYDASFATYSDNACTANVSNLVTLTGGVVVTSPADLALSLTDGIDSITAGDGVGRSYSITVTNAAGAAPAVNVSLNGQWPPGLSRGAITPSQGSCSGPAAFTCSLGTLAGGASATVAVSYTVPPGTTSSPQIHSANVSTTSSDATMANNSASDSDVVVTSADLVVTKDDGVASVAAGDGVIRSFTVTARNLGPSDSQGVQISDVWPAGYSRGAVTDAYGSCSGTPSFTCDLGSIPAGGSRSIAVSYTVPVGTTGSQTNSRACVP